jgi:hypothetical protein
VIRLPDWLDRSRNEVPLLLFEGTVAEQVPEAGAVVTPPSKTYNTRDATMISASTGAMVPYPSSNRVCILIPRIRDHMSC